MKWLSANLWLFFSVLLCASLTAYLFFVRWRQARAWHDENMPVERNGRVEVRFDIAEMQAIRSLLGAETANLLLKRLAARIKSRMKLPISPGIEAGTISLMLEASSVDDADERVRTISEMLSEKISVDGMEFCCTVSPDFVLGVNASPSGFTERLTDQGAEFRLGLLRELTAAIASDRLTLQYQPKVDLRAGIISSAEALLRWTRSDGSRVNIGELIELAEKTGMITHLSLWILNRAIADAKLMQQSGCPIETFVNISGGLLADSVFIAKLLAEIDSSDVKIGIEITETAVIADPDAAIRNLDKIANAGISIAIDDFGAGLSSLEYLRQLPAAELKIDRNFISALSSSNRNPLIVKASIDLAHALEMKVTAEGIDDPLSMGLLKVMGCDMAQGYLISPALPVLQLVDFVHNYNAASTMSGQLKPPAGAAHTAN